MAEQGLRTVIRSATPDDDVDSLLQGALARARHARGGSALVEQLWGPAASDEFIREAVARDVAEGRVWVALRDGELVGAALVEARCIRGLWVAPDHRRQGVATSLLSALLQRPDAPRDAWALPGDRATKSLYESVGWKARLLTMRGE